jgi:hypothetical protein
MSEGAVAVVNIGRRKTLGPLDVAQLEGMLKPMVESGLTEAELIETLQWWQSHKNDKAMVTLSTGPDIAGKYDQIVTARAKWNKEHGGKTKLTAEAWREMR